MWRSVEIRLVVPSPIPLEGIRNISFSKETSFDLIDMILTSTNRHSLNSLKHMYYIIDSPSFSFRFISNSSYPLIS